MAISARHAASLARDAQFRGVEYNPPPGVLRDPPYVPPANLQEMNGGMGPVRWNKGKGKGDKGRIPGWNNMAKSSPVPSVSMASPYFISPSKNR